jgi:hypothetical protein
MAPGTDGPSSLTRAHGDFDAFVIGAEAGPADKQIPGSDDSDLES